ncbi:hypothetical protein JYU01_01610 [bacterium AH-315-L21]|nr:hypothetical protein [bacterium AH-315-L21]
MFTLLGFNTRTYLFVFMHLFYRDFRLALSGEKVLVWSVDKGQVRYANTFSALAVPIMATIYSATL